MDFAVDHLLHAVNDPYEVRRAFEDRYGWTGTLGGEHPDWGTYNELAYFHLSYIEWIGIKNFVLAAQSRFGREVLRSLSVHEGVGQFALRTEDIDGLAAQWAKKGLPFWGPISGHRVRTDGSVLHWRLLFPGQDGPSDYALPFVIDWGQSDGERLASLSEAGIMLEQPNDLRLMAIHSLVHDIDSLQQRWEPYYGSLGPDKKYVEGVGTVINCVAGDVRLAFWEPESSQLKQELTRYGERPAQIDLAPKSNTAGQGRINDVAIIDANLEPLHGLRVQVAPSSEDHR
ncbi:VOC family protein [Alicyclobacillus curvatus]|nr:VOC family protein [Alicyclobacillus curvatus]